ncbi:hypothetical protein ZIOFF_055337 [Zingiber officinale]|uniref:Reverse transcriptase Ty1/copia-type domain-containing protein n=1 Tax=Zingiber officinale TaxID=94328 RepID=A0A8J5FJ06_ZINOF|nr:hypothetical protein ZIOFF_055337 [Zingiber officinale]
MPARFWGEEVRHAVYLLNRLPTKALGDRTPFEAWMGRKPHLTHLRVFGCVAYVKNTTLHLKKLDDRSSPMVYLGVEEGCKAHRLFNPRHGKLQVSRDVVFQENSEWTWTAGANHEENLPEFMVEDALDTDEVIVVADIEAGTEDVAPPATAVVPMTRASSPSTSSSSTHTTTSPDSHEGPVRFRSIADIYANTEEVVGIDEEEDEVILMMSEEPTCYQEAATEACWKINKFKQQMMTEFEMSDLGLLSYYLGIEVEHQKSRILLRQSTYAKKILSQFKMADCNATKHPIEPKTQLHKDLEGTPVDATEYRRVIGCLRYLLHTRPDLSYPVGMASRYMERPTTMHYKVVKQILRYLKGTIHFGLTYMKGPQEISIFGYSDSDLAGDLDGRKNTSGMTFYFNESLVSWNSQKQKIVALSSCEVEFMAATTAACHALWLRSLTSELTGEKPKPIVVEFINTGEQRVDVLTKALSGVKLAVMRQLLGVRDLKPCDWIPARSHPDSGRDRAGIRTRLHWNPDAGASGRDRDGGRCGRDNDGAIAGGIRHHRGRNPAPSRPESGRCQTPSDSRPDFNRNPAEIRARSGHHASDRNCGRISAGILAAGGWSAGGGRPEARRRGGRWVVPGRPATRRPTSFAMVMEAVSGAAASTQTEVVIPKSLR